jgi:4a-hydroxytetrahydrobiopterin dehydratase
VIVHSRAELVLRHCRPREAGALNDAQIRAQLAALPEWSLRDGSIVREYRFADYYETIAFVNALAFMVHREDHHPLLIVGYNGCTVRFDTHSVGGISENDFICAAKADAIFAQQFGHCAT